MRQGQHNKNRSRGRGGSNRSGGGSSGGGGRGGNPLNRVYESNGPDVKVRGNAQTIAEKYLQLARDAVSSGENVNAENYFQHAEHYLRIVSAAQAFNQQNQQVQQAQQQQQNQPRRDDGEDGDENASSGDSVANNNAENTAQPKDGDERENRRDGGRNNNRGQRERGRGGNSRAERKESEEAAVSGETNKDENWQSQAPDFLRRETPEVNSDDAPAAPEKPKRQPRARKPKPVEAASTEEAAPTIDEPSEDVTAA